jgi:hypothetical protein
MTWMTRGRGTHVSSPLSLLTRFLSSLPHVGFLPPSAASLTQNTAMVTASSPSYLLPSLVHNDRWLQEQHRRHNRLLL